MMTVVLVDGSIHPLITTAEDVAASELELSTIRWRHTPHSAPLSTRLMWLEQWRTAVCSGKRMPRPGIVTAFPTNHTIDPTNTPLHHIGNTPRVPLWTLVSFAAFGSSCTWSSSKQERACWPLSR